MLTDFDGFILSKTPYFIATSYKKMLEEETPEKKLKAILYIYNLGLRTLTLSFVSQYLNRDRERVSDPFLNKLLLEELPKGSLDAWQHILFLALRVYEGKRSFFFMPELYDFFWDSSTLEHTPRPDIEQTFTRLTQIYYDLEHGQSPTSQNDWGALLEEAENLLKIFLEHFSFIQYYELIRIINREGQTYTYEKHIGLSITQHQITLPEIINLELDWFYLAKQNTDFLLLDPLLIFWRDTPLTPPTDDWDIGLFERFSFNQLQYILSKFGDVIQDDGHVATFVQLIFNTIRQIKQNQNEIEKMTWWELQEVAGDISKKRMSTVQEKYNSKLYLQRSKIKSAFDDFLASQKRGFILVGKSGVGKSNFILSLVDEVDYNRHDNCILMYDAANLNPDLPITNIITQGFKDYLNLRGREFENIWHEIAQIDNIEEKKVILCIDAINENPRGQEILKQINELIQGPWHWLKVIITSRPEAWLNIKKGIKLAEILFYRSPKSDKLVVEMDDFSYSQRLDPFNNDELPQVYENYQTVYQLLSNYESLPKPVRESLRDPLVLWLTANIYQKKEIPSKVKTTNAIPDYIEAMLNTGRLEHKDLQFLKETLMQLMLQENKYSNSINSRQIELSGQKLFELINVESFLSNGQRVNQSFINLMDTEILIRRGEVSDYEITFKFERFYDYFAGLRLSDIFINVVDRPKLLADLVDKTKTYPFLWGAIKSLLMKDFQSNKEIVIPLAKTLDYFTRELATSALIDLGKDYRDDVVKILSMLIADNSTLKLQGFISKWSNQENQYNIHKNFGKLTAVEIASQLTIKDVLLSALKDSEQDIRVAAIQQIYHLLTIREIDLVSGILDELENQSFKYWYAPSFRAIESHITISLLIVFNFFEDNTILNNMQSRWNKIIMKIPFLNLNSEDTAKHQSSSKIRSIIINIIVTFMIRAIRQIEISKTAIVSLIDLKDSFKQNSNDIELLKRAIRYINVGQGSITNIRDELISLSHSKNLLITYASAMIFFAHFITEKDITIKLIRECFYTSLSHPRPTPFIGGIMLATEAFTEMNINKLDKEMWELFKEMLTNLENYSQCKVESYNKSYPWGQYNFFLYYYYLHISENNPPEVEKYIKRLENEKNWDELSVFISFFAQKNIDHSLNHTSILFILSFLNYPIEIVRTTSIHTLANLRAKYPVEIDDILKEQKTPLEARILIENHRAHQDIGMIFTVSLFNFWTKVIINKDERVINFIYEIADHIYETRNVRQWLTYIISRLIKLINLSSVKTTA